KGKFMKKYKIGILLLIMTVLSYGNDISYFNPSVKIGFNINWIEAQGYTKEHYFYPKLIFGLSNEFLISNSVFIQNDLYYKRSYSSFKYYPAAAIGPLFQHYNNQHVHFSILTGYKFRNHLKITSGLELLGLLDSKLIITEKKQKKSYKYISKNITSDLPNMEYALSFGLSKGVDIKRNEFYIETRFLYSLSRFSNKNFGPKCRNHTLNFLIGYKL
ncbi:MAG: hypothetical protein ACOC3V_05420, partial [bacterium]